MNEPPIAGALAQRFISAQKLAANPLKEVRTLAFKLSGLGAVVGLGGLAILAALGPVSVTFGVLALGGGLLLGSALLLLQSDRIAWQANPAAVITTRIAAGGFSPEIQQGLLARADFQAAIQGLHVLDTKGVISENNRSRAVGLALNYLADVAAKPGVSDQQIKTATEEVIALLALMHFNVNSNYETAKTSDRLQVQLTPVTRPPLVMSEDRTLRRAIRRLEGMGIIINIPIEMQPTKPMKLKSSDGAA